MQLQGIRGLAALTVVVSHTFELFYLTGNLGDASQVLGPIAHLFGILAAKAVWLFFVLSGFVLQIMISKGTSPNRFRIALSRWIRLFFPAAVAVALGFLLAFLFPPPSGDSFWIGVNPSDLDLASALFQFTFFSPGFTVGPLWTITWEITYSVLLLPFLVNLRMPGNWTSVFLLALISGSGRFFEIAPLEYLPMFLVGAVLFSMSKDSTPRKYFPRSAPILLALFLFLIVLNFIAGALVFGLSTLTYAIDVALTILAITAFLGISLQDGLVSKAMQGKAVTQLGEISFSLYLIHAPILLATYYATAGSALATVAAAFASIPLARGYFALIERPSHRLSRAALKID